MLLTKDAKNPEIDSVIENSLRIKKIIAEIKEVNDDLLFPKF